MSRRSEVRLEDLGEFVAWRRRPPRMRDGRVAVPPSVEAHCMESTVNRKLSVLSGFYSTPPGTVSISVNCWLPGSLPGGVAVHGSRSCTTGRALLGLRAGL